MTTRDQSLHVLQHSLGLDQYGQGNAFRNHFVAAPGHHDWELLQQHVAAGRMVEHAPRDLFGGSSCFTVTDAGREYVRANSPPPPKVSRGRQRYLKYLDASDADHDLTFGEFLRRGAQ